MSGTDGDDRRADGPDAPEESDRPDVSPNAPDVGSRAVPAGTESAASTPVASYDRRTTVIARTVVRIVVPVIVLAAIGLLFQGHNRPGGGFIGAVLTATAFVLVYVVFGMEYLQSALLGVGSTAEEAHQAVEYYRWVFAAGLGLAVVSGLVPIMFGYEFLTQAVLFLHHVPLYGEFELASAFAFDLGVYLAVVGGLLTVIGEVGEE